MFVEGNKKTDSNDLSCRHSFAFIHSSLYFILYSHSESQKYIYI